MPRALDASAKHVVTALRSFLGFLHLEGLLAEPLARAVPSVAGWRLAGIPRDSAEIEEALSGKLPIRATAGEA